METYVVEQSQISPAEGGGAEQSLPLVYFDIVGLRIPHMQTLLFYSLPSLSKPHFFNTILPDLENSLSLTLKHFLPLAGNIIFPLNSGGMPISHYAAADEDSVSLTIAVSGSDFSLLTANHPKDTDVLYELVPEISSYAAYSSDSSMKFPVMAVQITLFPNQGICIGVTCHHAICDGTAFVCFLQTWASINKFKGEKALGRKVLPVYNRSAVQDSDRLTPLIWKMMNKSSPTVSSAISFPTHKLRGTFLLRDEEILKLKNFLILMLKKAHVSSNTAVCARVWSCLAAGAGEGVRDDEVEYLWMPVECRGKLKPPLPITYFGNCVVLVLAECAHGRLRGSGGFVAAAEAIGEGLRQTLENEKGILDGCAEKYLRMKEMGKRTLVAGGSPNFDLSGIDYGWGGMKKLEALNIDGTLTLCKTMEGIEVGMSMTKLQMDAFASLFNKHVYDHMHASKL